MPTDPAPQSAKDERQRWRAEWLREGLGVDQIARRFRLEYDVGALAAYRWANDLTQLEVANAYSERFLGADERLFPQRISEFEKWPRERGGREPPLSVLERLAILYGTTADQLVAAVLSKGDRRRRGATAGRAHALGRCGRRRRAPVSVPAAGLALVR